MQRTVLLTKHRKLRKLKFTGYMNVHGDNTTTNMVFIHRNALKINIENCGKIEFFKNNLQSAHTLYTVL